MSIFEGCFQKAFGELGLKPDSNDVEFENDMIEFAADTAELPSISGDLSRKDIYFDHMS